MWGAIAAAGASLAGDIMNSAVSHSNAQAAVSASKEAALANLQYQKEFAQNGIRWRVEDATEAGLHPLAALGAQTPQFTPSFSMDAFNSPKASYGNALKNLGQNVNRAMLAKQRDEDRALENSWKAAQIEKLKADTAYMNAMAAKSVVDHQQLPPSMPSLSVNNHGQVIDGQPDSGLASVNKLIDVSPSQTEANVPSRPGTAAATVPDISFARTNDGGYALTRSQSLANRMDDDYVGSALWHIRNSLPQLWESERVRPPLEYLPKGATRWRFDIFRGAWYPHYPDNRPHRRDFVSRSGSRY